MFIIFVPVYFYTRIYANGAIVLYLYESDFYTNFTKNKLITFFNQPDFIISFYFLHLNWLIQMIWQVMIVKFLYSITTGQDAIDEKDQAYFKKKN